MQAKNIIVPFDFSDSSEVALQFATSLARDGGATLHIVHVKKPLMFYVLEPKYGDVARAPNLDELKTVLQRIVPNDRNVPHKHWLYTSDDVPKRILKLANELPADLIVMGTHGRTGLDRLIMGSVAESVVRHARCPVITVKHPKIAVVNPVPKPSPA